MNETAEPRKSQNHIAFLGNYEFFTDWEGNLYKASIGNAIDPSTNNRFGRFEAPAHLTDNVMRMLLEAFSEEA